MSFINYIELLCKRKRYVKLDDVMSLHDRNQEIDNFILKSL